MTGLDKPYVAGKLLKVIAAAIGRIEYNDAYLCFFNRKLIL
jgi:hypothetical protein